MFIKLKLCLAIILLFSISSCMEDRNFAEYKMYSYASKAYVDSIDFPLIKIFDNTQVEIVKLKEKFYGNIIDKEKGKMIRLSDGREMKMEFNKERTEVIVYTLVNINVEAKYGSFKLLTRIK